MVHTFHRYLPEENGYSDQAREVKRSHQGLVPENEYRRDDGSQRGYLGSVIPSLRSEWRSNLNAVELEES